MKAAALTHLLHRRARQMRGHLAPLAVADLEILQQSLRIEHRQGCYQVSWSHRGQAFQLEVPDRAFHFHVTGDSPGSVARREAGRDYQADNLSAAAVLWRQVGELCGLALPEEPECPAAGADDGGELRPTALVWLPPLLVGLVALALAGLTTALWTWAAAFLLCGQAVLLCSGHRAGPLRLGESALVAAGALVPVAVGGDAGGVVLLLAGQVAVCLAERVPAGRLRWLGWLGAGALAGCGFGGAGRVAALVVALPAGIVALAAPDRLPWAGVALFAAAVVATPSVVGVMPLAAPPFPLLAGAAALAMMVGAFLWWRHGVLRHLMPWLSMVCLGVSAGLAGFGDGATATGAFLGLAALLAIPRAPHLPPK